MCLFSCLQLAALVAEEARERQRNASLHHSSTLSLPELFVGETPIYGREDASSRTNIHTVRDNESTVLTYTYRRVCVCVCVCGVRNHEEREYSLCIAVYEAYVTDFSTHSLSFCVSMCMSMCSSICSCCNTCSVFESFSAANSRRSRCPACSNLLHTRSSAAREPMVQINNDDDDDCVYITITSSSLITT